MRLEMMRARLPGQESIRKGVPGRAKNQTLFSVHFSYYSVLKVSCLTMKINILYIVSHNI